MLKLKLLILIYSIAIEHEYSAVAGDDEEKSCTGAWQVLHDTEDGK